MGAAPFLFALAPDNLGPASAAPIGTVATITTSKILLPSGNVQKTGVSPSFSGKDAQRAAAALFGASRHRGFYTPGKRREPASQIRFCSRCMVEP
jgi:hypothetical protein